MVYLKRPSIKPHRVALVVTGRAQDEMGGGVGEGDVDWLIRGTAAMWRGVRLPLEPGGQSARGGGGVYALRVDICCSDRGTS